MFGRLREWLQEKREYYGYYLRGDTPQEKKCVRLLWFAVMITDFHVYPFCSLECLQEWEKLHKPLLEGLKRLKKDG